MSTNYDDIVTAIMQHIVDATLSFPVYFEQEEQGDADVFARAAIVPASHIKVELGEPGRARIGGNVVVAVYQRQSALGIGGIWRAVDEIVTLFKPGTELTYNGVTVHFEEPVPQGGREDGLGYYQVPVTAAWYSLVSN